MKSKELKVNIWNVWILSRKFLVFLVFCKIFRCYWLLWWNGDTSRRLHGTWDGVGQSRCRLVESDILNMASPTPPSCQTRSRTSWTPSRSWPGDPWCWWGRRWGGWSPGRTAPPSTLVRGSWRWWLLRTTFRLWAVTPPPPVWWSYWDTRPPG